MNPSAMFWIPLAGPLAAAIGLLVLVGIRLLAPRENAAAVIATYCGAYAAAVGSTFAIVVWTINTTRPTAAALEAGGAIDAALLGAAIGAALYFMLGFGALYLAPAFNRWAWRSTDTEESFWLKGWSLLLGLVGSALCFALFLLGGYFIETWDLAPFLILPFVALIPFYQSLLLPWLRYIRSPTLQLSASEILQNDPVRRRGIADIQKWLDGLVAERRFPRFHMRVQRGDMVNAFATGGVFRHLIVIGGGILEKMAVSEIKAVVAHEVAHVVRKDVLRLLPYMALATVGHFATHLFYVGPLFNDGRFIIGCVLVGSYVAVFFLLIPQYFLRRAEYRADELAVKLLGDRQPLIEGLLKIAEFNGMHLDLTGVSHPSMNQRIAAIRQIDLPTDSPA